MYDVTIWGKRRMTVFSGLLVAKSTIHILSSQNRLRFVHPPPQIYESHNQKQPSLQPKVLVRQLTYSGQSINIEPGTPVNQRSTESFRKKKYIEETPKKNWCSKFKISSDWKAARLFVFQTENHWVLVRDQFRVEALPCKSHGHAPDPYVWKLVCWCLKWPVNK